MTSYFSSKGPARASAKKGCSSLADLDLDISDEDARSQLQNFPEKNREAKQALFAKHVRDFPKWLLPLREGYSLLFYGLGSKKALLETFAHKELLDGGVVVFNGFRPTLKLREILSTVAAQFEKPRGGDNHAILEQIRSVPVDGGVLYIVLHNIDGPGLRARELQEILSELSRCPAIRLIASVDHVNSCLLWDKRTAARFNWLYFDVTTYAAYTVEAREMPSLLIGRRESVRSSNAATVLRTLVPQARAIFRLLAEHQMEEKDECDEEGMTFSQLFRMSRERLLVANDAALRGHLTEFKDHDLLQTRRGQDGSDLLIIPIEPQTLLQVLEDVDAPT